MTRAVPVMFFALFALSCGGKGASRFRGHWQGVEAQGTVKGGDPRAANDFATSMDLVVRSRDLTLSYRTKNLEKVTVSSAYRVVRDEGDRISVEAELDKGENSQFEFPTENSLLWSATDTSKIRFERVLD